MNIQKKILPKVQAELTIEIPVEQVKQYLAKAAQRISESVHIAGFRKGHIPYDILKRHVGEAAIYEEAFRDIVAATLPQALEQEKLDIVGQPSVDPEKIAPNNPLVYKATISLYPDVELGSYTSLKATKKEIEGDEKKVTEMLEDLRKMRASERVVNRPAQKGDKVLMDFDVLLDNVVIENGSYKKQSIEIGSNHFTPGFEEQLMGVKKGDIKEFTLRFPKEYHQKNLADRDAGFKLAVHEVYEVILPDVSDAWAKSIGSFENLDAMKKAIRENLKKEEETKERQRFEGVLIEEIIQNTKFGELPEILVRSEIEKMMHEIEDSIVKEGGKFDEYLQSIKKNKEDLGKDFRPQAEKRVKAALVIREIARKENIATPMEEIEREIEGMKNYYEKVQPEIIARIQTPEYRQYLGNVLNNQKVLQFLTEKHAPKKVEK